MLNNPRSKNRIFTKVISLLMAVVFLSANTVYPDSLRPPLLFSSHEKTVKYLKASEYEVFARELIAFMQGKDLTIQEMEGQVKYYLNNYTRKSAHWEADVNGKSPQIVAFFEDKKVVDKSDQSNVLTWVSEILDVLKDASRSDSNILHASWTSVKYLNKGRNYDASDMIMSDRRVADISLIKSLREQAKGADIGRDVEIEGYEFNVIEIKNQKILISKDISKVISDGEMLAILSRALSETDFKNTQDGLPLIVISLLKSPRMFEDCRRNGFIGINQAFLGLYKNNPQSRKYLQVLLQVGLEHELRHEAGKTDEFELANIDASRMWKLCNIEKVNIAEFIEFLKVKGIIDERFEKTIRLTVQSEENKAKLIKLYEANPDSFLFPEEGPYKIIEYMRKDPYCFIGYGDMSKIRVMNKVFTDKILDMLIPVIVEVCNKILDKYHGIAVRLGEGRGDEIALALPSCLNWDEVNNIRLELQDTISKFLSGRHGFVKVEGIDEESDYIWGNREGFMLYKDKDGYFLLFDRKKSGSRSLKGACDRMIGRLNQKLINEGFKGSVKGIGVPIDLPSPRLIFGIVKAKRGMSENAKDSYKTAIDHAEYIKRISEEKRGLNGATSELVKRFDNFYKDSSGADLLSDKERRKIAGRYSKQYLGKYNINGLYFEHIENYYPVIKKEFLRLVILRMKYAEPGSVFIIRGPPDNFYIAVKLKSGWVFFKTGFFYNPKGSLETRLNDMQNDDDWFVKKDNLRFTWMGYGFKMINELYSHSIGNEVIFKAISSLENVLEKKKEDFKNMNSVDFRKLADDINAEFNKNIKTIVTRNLGSAIEVRTAIGTIMFESGSALKPKDISKLINTMDDLIEIAKVEIGGEGNIVNNAEDYTEDLFLKNNKNIRAAERRKFYPILRNAYDKPALAEADIGTYKLLNITERVEDALNSVHVIMDHHNSIAGYKNIELSLRKMDTLLGLVSPLEFNKVKSMLNNLPPWEKIRMAYNIDRIMKKNMAKSKEHDLVNLGYFFDKPEFFKDNILGDFTIIPYALTYASSLDEIEAFTGDIRGFTRFDPFVVEEDDGYVFRFLKEAKEYRILVTKDFELKLKEIREKVNISEASDIKDANLEEIPVWNNSIMCGIIERTNRLGGGGKQHSLEGVLKNIILSLVLDRGDLTSVDYSNVKKEVLDKIKETVREVDFLYDEGRYDEIIAEANERCLENVNTGNRSLKDLLESESVGQSDISQLLAETAMWLGADSMRHLSPLKAGELMRRLYVILKAIQILAENEKFEKENGLEGKLEAVATRDDL